MKGENVIGLRVMQNRIVIKHSLKLLIGDNLFESNVESYSYKTQTQMDCLTAMFESNVESYSYKTFIILH